MIATNGTGERGPSAPTTLRLKGRATAIDDGEMEVMHLFVGAIAIAFGWQSYKVFLLTRQAEASRRWPTARGTITRSEPVQECAGPRSTTRVWVPRIEYEFEANGRTWHGSRIAFKSSWYTSFPDRAEAKCLAYAVGTEVPVYHDPVEPAESCLEPTVGTLAGGYVMTVLFAAGAVGGITFVLQALS